jgi:hypothetical protein
MYHVVDVVGGLLRIYYIVGIICACYGIQSNNVRDQPQRVPTNRMRRIMQERGQKPFGCELRYAASVPRGNAQSLKRSSHRIYDSSGFHFIFKGESVSASAFAYQKPRKCHFAHVEVYGDFCYGIPFSQQFQILQSSSLT